MDATAEGGRAQTAELTVGALVREVAERLAGASAIDEPAAEARELVAALFDAPRFWPGLHAGTVVEGTWWERALLAAAMRRRGAPLAYCVGRAPFRRFTLEVDERVLIPRPETEQLVDVALSVAGPSPGGVAVDVGTGSGAIALALASEGHFERVIATDISLDALAVAGRNSRLLEGALRAPLEFRQGSLLAPLGEERPRLVVCNPPYVASSEAAVLPSSVRDWEPPVALMSGEDGMRATAQLLRQAAARLAPGGVLALELDSRRAGAASRLAETDARFADVRVLPDLAGRERFLVARRKED
jgi:release factor glutamine methyltransferase